MCNCDKSPEDEQDMKDIASEWFQAAQQICIPALLADKAEEEAETVANQYANRNVLTIASNIPQSGKMIRAVMNLFPDSEIQYRPINQVTGEVEERVA